MERIQRIWDDTELGRDRIGAIYVTREDPRIVLCDPHFIESASPLAQQLVAGHNWSITLLKQKVDGHTRIAAVLVALDISIFNRKRGSKAQLETPVKWSEAVFEDGSTTFAVDYATACVTDARTASEIKKMPLLREQFMGCIDGPWDCAFLNTDDGCGEVAWFGSGLGDGNYSAWWGHDNKDQIVALCIDFNIIT